MACTEWASCRCKKDEKVCLGKNACVSMKFEKSTDLRVPKKSPVCLRVVVLSNPPTTSWRGSRVSLGSETTSYDTTQRKEHVQRMTLRLD